MSDLALQTGLRALLAARFSLDTIGHNLANANTPGYSRQSVQVQTASPFLTRGVLIGGGVDADSVQRTVDKLLNTRILNQVGIGGGLEAQLGLMSEIEALFGEPGENSLGSRIDGFFGAVSELSTSPSDSILQNGLVQSAQILTGQFNELSSSMERIRVDVMAEAEARIEEVNGLAQQISSLNLAIGESEVNGVEANDLRDERQRLLGELAELVDVRTVEENDGSLRVLVAGNTLVGRTHANTMSATSNPNGDLAIRIDGAKGFVPVKSGALGGLLDFREELVTKLGSDLDRLARNLILEVNRAHSTGVPSGGAFRALTGSNGLQDIDGDGLVTDELLANAGLPFDVQTGSLDVNVTDEATGEVTKHRISISSSQTTVQDFLDELNAIANLSAEVDGFGRLRVQADTGHGFDFSRRVDPNPDGAGTFGGLTASLGSATGPFALDDGDTLELTVDNGGGPQALSIAFDTAAFGEISQATPAEVAAAINADAGAQAAGVRAVVADGRVYLQTLSEGTGASLTVDGGSAVGALGLTGQVGTPVTGHAQSVDVTLTGTFTGAGDDTFSFRPRSDGTIGTTPDLVVDVFDSNGQLVTTLDVGQGYTPGEQLQLPDGLRVSFGLGELSATNNDAFAVDAVTDSDSSDVLVALGLNGLFQGTDASTIAVREDLADDPSLLASSISGSTGDNATLLELLDVEGKEADELEGRTIGRFYGGIVGELGFQVSTATEAYTANATLLGSLEQRRDSISGVNVDEELVDLVRYEQAFSAAAQYITVVNQLGDELLSLI